ncbi:Yqey-like protein-domain-containing protein [Blyttiomyces helicus]|uniref:Altered inheritance of mitochondria protein 41 n=1 Tax=Blyttiomyces helicus TaxID=388810 RepID=A0A4P9VYT9_9FUNG|nr:Yqey-like protein-domain-containing protein [Blyttiomyces helicus]|eukprot:RKO84135.1 Yqey-like protein-domain-containing protein [Blyttiomyces helicus]
MLSKNKIAVNTVKGLLSDIAYASKSVAAPPPLATIIHRSVQRRREAAMAYREGGREDLAAAEDAERAVLETYLPEQMSEEEIEKRAREVAERVGAAGVKDVGKVMKVLGLEIDEAVAPKKLMAEVAKRVLASMGKA